MIVLFGIRILRNISKRLSIIVVLNNVIGDDVPVHLLITGSIDIALRI